MWKRIIICLDRKGDGVEKDEKRALHHLKGAPSGGVPMQDDRGCIEYKNGRTDRAVKHWIIAVKLGHDRSMNAPKEGCKRGELSREDLASSPGAHQAAVDATKSPQRGKAVGRLLAVCLFCLSMMSSPAAIANAFIPLNTLLQSHAFFSLLTV
jgi:hypothetical protein